VPTRTIQARAVVRVHNMTVKRALLLAQLLDAGMYTLSVWSFALHALGDWRCHEPSAVAVATEASHLTRGFAPHDEPALLAHSLHAPLAAVGVGVFYAPASRRGQIALLVLALAAAAGDVAAFVTHARDTSHEHTPALSNVYAGLAALLAASAATIATYTALALQHRHSLHRV